MECGLVLTQLSIETSFIVVSCPACGVESGQNTTIPTEDKIKRIVVETRQIHRLARTPDKLHNNDNAHPRSGMITMSDAIELTRKLGTRSFAFYDLFRTNF